MKYVNPFTLEFGVQPPEYIDRFIETAEILEDFSSANPSTHMYALLGPRGCGKTVMLNNVAGKISERDDWISVSLNCKGDLLLQLAASLDEKVHSNLPKLSTEFSFSFSFLSVTLKGKEHVSDVHVLLQKMFESLKKHNKKVLVAIDDIVANQYIKVFAKEFQILRGAHMPIFLMMTGLYSAFHKLENIEGLTFLHRAPKVYLGPLSEKAIALTYQHTMDVSKEKAIELASYTMGYAFAYQCLGYIKVKYQKKEIDDEVLLRLDYYLEEGVYSKLWDKFSKKEKEILKVLASHGKISNKDLIETGLVDANTISTYKKMLNRKGAINTGERGYMSFALPRFREYILDMQANI